VEVNVVPNASTVAGAVPILVGVIVDPLPLHKSPLVVVTGKLCLILVNRVVAQIALLTTTLALMG
jgi:hypothetical protein